MFYHAYGSRGRLFEETCEPYNGIIVMFWRVEAHWIFSNELLYFQVRAPRGEIEEAAEKDEEEEEDKEQMFEMVTILLHV